MAARGAADGSAPNVAKYEVMSDNLHRHEMWGDDPEERDASEVVAEISSVDPEAARRWHDHPAVVPLKVVGRFIARNGRRIAITVVGIVVLLAGLALLVLPGPGWLLIFVGLSILGTEYVWAQRMLRVAKEQANKAKDKVLRRKQAKADRRDGASSDGPDVS
jgi:Putative transmembrane protein (PGPGW)